MFAYGSKTAYRQEAEALHLIDESKRIRERISQTNNAEDKQRLQSERNEILKKLKDIQKSYKT